MAIEAEESRTEGAHFICTWLKEVNSFRKYQEQQPVSPASSPSDHSTTSSGDEEGVHTHQAQKRSVAVVVDSDDEDEEMRSADGEDMATSVQCHSPAKRLRLSPRNEDEEESEGGRVRGVGGGVSSVDMLRDLSLESRSEDSFMDAPYSEESAASPPSPPNNDNLYPNSEEVETTTGIAFERQSDSTYTRLSQSGQEVSDYQSNLSYYERNKHRTHYMQTFENDLRKIDDVERFPRRFVLLK